MLIRGKDETQWSEVEGTFGEFVPPGGGPRVSYVLTQASLSLDGSGASRLTRDLVPVREVFDVDTLDFGELLQRDVDDQRVMSEIIPYLLKLDKAKEFVRFFPPVLVVVVPVAGKTVEDRFPALGDVLTAQHGTSPTHTIETQKFGSTLAVERIKAQDGSYERQACLRYNPDRTRLIVIDGQHRAMALLAIRRTLAGDWGHRGEDFKHFYQGLDQQLRALNVQSGGLPSVELPVCLCYFPDLHAGEIGPLSMAVACRKLFLDVNKQAKKPSKSRNLLLDDVNLLSILTRAVLSGVRSTGDKQDVESPQIDLDCLEYDSPTDDTTPGRPLAVASVQMIHSLVYWVGFGRGDYFVNLAKTQQGRPPVPDTLRFLKEIRSSEVITSAEAQSWDCPVLETGLDYKDVPLAAHDKLSALFMDSWGEAIIEMYSRLAPFRAHVLAVRELRAGHQSETGFGRLAWRGLFDGQGVYWTLKATAEHRDRLRREGRDLPKLDAESAYLAIKNDWIPKKFHKNRAKHFFAKKGADLGDEDVASSLKSYEVLRTLAFQIGFVMAVAHLKAVVTPPEKAARKLMVACVAAWNRTFAGAPRAFCDAGKESPYNSFSRLHPGRLQPQDWIWFRYFSLEMMVAGKLEEDEYWASHAKVAAEELRWETRKRLIKAHIEGLKTQGIKCSEKDAAKEVDKRFRAVLKSVCGLNVADFDAFVRARAGLGSTVEPGATVVVAIEAQQSGDAELAAEGSYFSSQDESSGEI